MRDKIHYFGKALALIVSILMLSLKAQAKVEYDATGLLLESPDQVTQRIQKKIREAQRLQKKHGANDEGDIVPDPEAVERLRDAMRIALSRPDQDGARGNMFMMVRRELLDLEALDAVLKALVEEAIRELRTQDGPRRSATYIVLLENLIAELRQTAEDEPADRKLIERIRDAKIEVLNKVKIENLLRPMSIPVSPSKTAEEVLKAMDGSAKSSKDRPKS